MKNAGDISSHLMDPFLTPATLAMNLWPSGPKAWVPAPHLVYMSHRIATAVLKQGSRIIISVPPQHGKSTIATLTTIPWYLKKFPGRSMILVSYNETFAESWGGKVKDIIGGRPDLFDYRIRDDRSSVSRFETTKGSVCHFLGINSGQTGKDASLIVIDDYIKGIKEAMNAGVREDIWQSYVANIDSRVQNNTSIIIIATRWWSDDLIGRLLKYAPGDWEYICFPAFAKEGDILGRKPGEVLFPEVQSRETLLKKKKLAEFAGVIFDALYQQEPVDDHSEFTNSSWLKVARDVDMTGMRLCRAWDFAATQGGGDFTTGTKMGRKGLNRPGYIFNVISAQLSPLKVEELIRRTAVADGFECTVLLEQEAGSQAASLIEHYKHNVLPDFNVVSVPAGNKSKFLRAQPFIAAVQSGNVFMVDDSGHTGVGAWHEPDWMQDFRTEFGNFGPKSVGHDDRIDTGSMAYNFLFGNDVKTVTWGNDDEGVSRYSPGAGQPHIEVVSSLDHVYGSGGGESSKLVTGVTW